MTTEASPVASGQGTRKRVAGVDKRRSFVKDIPEPAAQVSGCQGDAPGIVSLPSSVEGTGGGGLWLLSVLA